MVEFVERYLDDERLHEALMGQGVIGTNATPHEPGTASIHFHHASGRMGGIPGMWGYMKGGMGRVSFLLADIARDAGVLIAAGVPVSRILPGEGVELESGDMVRAPAVISTADPHTTRPTGRSDAHVAARKGGRPVILDPGQPPPADFWD